MLRRALAALLTPLAVPPALLLSVSETAEGQACALACVCLLLTAALALCRAPRRAVLASAATAAALTAFAAARAPGGTPAPGSGFSSHWIAPARFHRFSPANLVPEIDQIKLTSTDLAVRFLGGSLPLCLRHTLGMYRAMHASDEYRALGSVLHDGWAELFGRPRAGAHWWKYAPPHAPGKRLPVLIFFHGFGGNYKSYLWVWKHFADQAGVAVVIPSLGFGFVDDRAPMLDMLLEAWRDDPDLDLANAWLAGLSNGAVPAARAAAARPGAYRGVVLMSPIADGLATAGTRAYRADRALDLAPYPPVLVLYGVHDGGIDDALVEHHARRLAALDVKVTRRGYAGMDHFLIYRAQERYYADLAAWMAEVSATGPRR